jgi:monoamine oxidase
MDADVIVIGAGAAGLAAARTLALASLSVLLIEARDRAGGRVLTLPTPRPMTPAELGAEFIHGTARETFELLRAAGTAAVDTGGEAWSFEDGRLQRDVETFVESASIFEATRSLREDESADRFLRRFENDAAKRATAQTARGFVEGFEAADPAIASVRAIAEELRSGVDRRSARPLGGYAPVFQRLCADCGTAGVRTRLSTVVRAITWRRGAVSVGVRGEARALRARAAIVTLPVGVLRHRGDESEIAFDPPLPAAKSKALAHIEMGHVVRVVLAFRTPFWERVCDARYRDAAFFHGEGWPFPAYWTQLPVRGEHVVAWAGGPKAIALEGMAEAELVALALKGFGELFDESALAQAEFSGGMMHDWTRDAFARGAYSYITVGGEGARAALGAPLDGALFFAGEATSTDGQGGTVNGALQTGARAANEVLQALA